MINSRNIKYVMEQGKIQNPFDLPYFSYSTQPKKKNVSNKSSQSKLGFIFLEKVLLTRRFIHFGKAL